MFSLLIPLVLAIYLSTFTLSMEQKPQLRLFSNGNLTVFDENITLYKNLSISVLSQNFIFGMNITSNLKYCHWENGTRANDTMNLCAKAFTDLNVTVNKKEILLVDQVEFLTKLLSEYKQFGSASAFITKRGFYEKVKNSTMIENSYKMLEVSDEIFEDLKAISITKDTNVKENYVEITLSPKYYLSMSSFNFYTNLVIIPLNLIAFTVWKIYTKNQRTSNLISALNLCTLANSMIVVIYLLLFEDSDTFLMYYLSKSALLFIFISKAIIFQFYWLLFYLVSIGWQTIRLTQVNLFQSKRMVLYQILVILLMLPDIVFLFFGEDFMVIANSLDICDLKNILIHCVFTFVFLTNLKLVQKRIELIVFRCRLMKNIQCQNFFEKNLSFVKKFKVMIWANSVYHISVIIFSELIFPKSINPSGRESLANIGLFLLSTSILVIFKSQLHYNNNQYISSYIDNDLNGFEVHYLFLPNYDKLSNQTQFFINLETQEDDINARTKEDEAAKIKSEPSDSILPLVLINPFIQTYKNFVAVDNITLAYNKAS